MDDKFITTKVPIFMVDIEKPMDVQCFTKVRVLAEKGLLRGEIFFQKDIDELYEKDTDWFYGYISSKDLRNGISIVNVTVIGENSADSMVKFIRVSFISKVIFGNRDSVDPIITKIIEERKCYLKPRIAPISKDVITFDLIIKEDSGIEPENLRIY